MPGRHRILLFSIYCGWFLPTHVNAHGHDHDHVPGRVQYIENKGQWPAPVLFRSGVQGATVFLERDGASYVKLEEGTSDRMHDFGELSEEEQAAFIIRGHAWRMRFVDPDPALSVVGHDAEAGYHNYFLGNDPSRWTSNVQLFSSVLYRGVWPGIDINYYGHADGHLKYDILLEPGASSASIGLSYVGVDGLRLDDQGRLVLATSVGEVLELAPVAHYTDGAREDIPCRYLMENGILKYQLQPGYDASRPVTIDPLLIASTFSGATGNDNWGHCATYDDQGNIYTGARNFGPTYPVTPGAFQTTPGGGWSTSISLSKLNPEGSGLLWASYLGGSSAEAPHSLVANSQGHLYVLGSTQSTDFPVTANAYDNTYNGGWDMIVTVVNATGTALLGSTFIGGSGNDGFNFMSGNANEEYRGEIITDAADNILVASFSSSANFPTTAGAYQTALAGGQDAVVLALNPTASNMLFSTFLGGSQDDAGLGIRSVDGSVVVCGYTASANFPTVPGAYQPTYQGGATDCFVVKFDLAGTTLQASTFFGTNAMDRAYFIDYDLGGNIWIYGQSDGNIPIQPAGTWGQANGHVFIAKLDPTLATAPVTTVLAPGNWWDFLTPVAFLVDVCDNIYISGYSAPSDLPTTPDALYTSGSFYLAAYDVDLTDLLFATYHGGSHVDGGTSRFDKNGIIYQGVCSGMGSMVTTPWAYAPTQNVSWDIGVFKIDFQVAGVNAAGASTLNSGCALITIDFQNNSTGDVWFWDFGDGSPIVEAFEPSHMYSEPGTYIVTLIALDSLSCNLADTTYMPITIGQAETLVSGMQIQQIPDCAELTVEGENMSTGTGIAFHWDMGDGTILNDTNIVHTYSVPGQYLIQLIVYDPLGCSPSDTLSQQVQILPPLDVQASFDVDQQPGCDVLGVICQSTSVGMAPMVTWDMGDGTTFTGALISHTFQGVGTYTITMMVTDSLSCNQADQTTLDVEVLPSIPVDAGFTAEQVFDCLDLLLITVNTSTGTNMVYQWNMGDGSEYSDENIEHVFSGAGTYTITLHVSDALGCSPPSQMSQEVMINALIPVIAAFDVEQVGNCTQLTVLANDQSTGDSLALSWDMGDGTVYTGTPPEHVYSSPGSYTITLTATDLACGNDDQTSMQVQLINTLPVVLLGDTVVCPGGSATLLAGGPSGEYLWNTGETTPSITVDYGGTYMVTVTTNDCQGTAWVDVIERADMELGYEVEACPNAGVPLSVPIEGLTYLWSNGSNERTIQVLGPGVHIFTVVDLYGCQYTDTVEVIALDEKPQLFAPNAFTPDGDGVNEEFRIVGYGEKDVEFTIFNRWGEQLWQTNDPYQGWDGRHNGALVKTDVYVYRLKYTGVCNAEEKEMIGHVTVLR